ncbi:L-aspartate oxidase [Paenibacillus sp. chi10]|uniref:L-aspartate oxidase n=1 Tax=Paenibacillus suaedae TaxID=3077233 RepID=A0AAJ2N5B1_9BACL|nr:L-aspartate oxidase [Paenibacillus sp. chi10]MDT8980263.1 L-aspartate oxidase [Paenibacillus sp. chi10]
MEKGEHSVIVVGSGVAALSLLSSLPPHIHATVLTKGTVSDSNSILAQGGIATSYLPDDTMLSHIADTLEAGAGHNDLNMVQTVIREGKEIMLELVEAQFPFDRDRDGRLMLGREGAHRANRIFHAGGDASGRMLVEYLLQQIPSHVQIREYVTVIDLLVEKGHCNGVVLRSKEGQIETLHADHVVLATGGCGSLYRHHSNHQIATGDGLMLAYRAGAHLTDLEFMQFHPTLLVKDDRSYGLVSEAVRGEGGVLIDEYGRRIMEGRHELKDLAPRDVVARVIHEEMRQGHAVYMDIQACLEFRSRFPSITRLCEEAGVDLEKGRIPVAPGMHFLMGGIQVNEWAESSIHGLFAIGEAGCNGLHGANRLASNSLLEALVTGRRAAMRIRASELGKLGSRADEVEANVVRGTRATGAFTGEAAITGEVGMAKEVEAEIVDGNVQHSISIQVPQTSLAELQRRMTAAAAIERNREQLQGMKQWLMEMPTQALKVQKITREQLELANLWQLAQLVTESALLREESRGAHYRSDCPNRDYQNWGSRQIVHSLTGIQIVRNERIVPSWNVFS